MESLNAKISSSSQDFVNSVQNVGVYAYDARENVQAFRRVPANPDGALITEDITGYAEYFGSAQIEIGSAAATAVLADSTITPTQGLDGRTGWQFKNTVGGTAYNINYFDGASESIVAGDLQSVYTRMFIDKFDIANQDANGVNFELPRIEIYTKPTGVGDFDPTYHSRWIYAVDSRIQHIGLFEDCVFYALGGPSKRFGERTIPMNIVTLEGDGDLGGEILKIVVSSPVAGVPAASIDVCVNMVGWENNSTIAPLARAYRLVYPADTGGDATAANQVLEIAELTQIATNTERLAPQLNRTEAIPVQIMVGSGGTQYDALRANGQDLMVMIDDMNPDVAVNSGLSTATKQDDMITHLADIDNQTNGLLTYQVLINNTQTNGTQVVKCMGDFGGSNVQLKVDANGVLETSGGGGGGGGTQYNQGDALGATPTGTLCIGKDNLGNAIPIHVTSAGDLEVEIADFVKSQATMANSFPVVISSDQSRVDVDTVKDEVTISQVNQSVINPASFTSTAVDMRGYDTISFFGNSSNTADEIYILVSADDITYYTTGEFVTKDFTTGDFSYNASLAVRYLKLRQGSGDYGGNFTISCFSSKK